MLMQDKKDEWSNLLYAFSVVFRVFEAFWVARDYKL